ncbi:unnamed protein product [Medioppia subpectinata]|uniref:Elongation of very long chain fatty acids protein n=1 Tax=Medioppia subpectinata TaxID=1979941 RepID=A0A7R9KGL2_9ACAR|nr:unnamed protein product [Medioppia subpectinata]CAG2103169.1 unnamed protein product [Medioppia subpectinata]
MDSLSPNYSFVFRFERDFDYKPRAQWMATNWTQAFYWSAAYLAVVFGGQHLMSRRKPFGLRTALVVWNLCLALFSVAGTLRTVPELVHVVRHLGFERSVCSNSFHTSVPVASFWSWLFILSKAPELGDTVFVVLRKQRLLFLHYYHHVTVLLFTWYSYADEASAGRWYIDMNYSVHALMYSYYALRALGFRVHRAVAMTITSAQIAQMLVGSKRRNHSNHNTINTLSIAAYVTAYALRAKLADAECRISLSTIVAGLAMYFSYFLLFANFFIKTYFKKSCGRSWRTPSAASRCRQ